MWLLEGLQNLDQKRHGLCTGHELEDQRALVVVRRDVVVLDKEVVLDQLVSVLFLLC